MRLKQEAEIRWQKSSFSAGEDTCVEIGNTLSAVRDSKNPDGPVLPMNVPALVAAVKTGRIG